MWTYNALWFPAEMNTIAHKSPTTFIPLRTLWLYTAKKKKILLRFFCLVSSQNKKKILNQEGFSRHVKIIVLFAEKTSQN